MTPYLLDQRFILLIDVLLHFRMHHVTLTADVSTMYRAIELVPPSSCTQLAWADRTQWQDLTQDLPEKLALHDLDSDIPASRCQLLLVEERML
jgi:hypothetical protein